MDWQDISLDQFAIDFPNLRALDTRKSCPRPVPYAPQRSSELEVFRDQHVVRPALL